MNIPRLITVILALGIGLTATAAADIELVRVWPGYRDAASFTSASEYFDGPAAKSHLIAQRSQPNHRAGYYWLVRTKSSTSISQAKVRLEVTRRGTTQAESYEFAVDIARGSHAVPIGLTGSDWASPEDVPVAWRLTIQTPEGAPLATQSSFLWQDTNR